VLVGDDLHNANAHATRTAHAWFKFGPYPHLDPSPSLFAASR